MLTKETAIAKGNSNENSVQPQASTDDTTTKSSSLTKHETTTPTATPNNHGGSTQSALGTTSTSGKNQAPPSTLDRILGYVVGITKNVPSTSEKTAATTISEVGLIPRFDVNVVKSPTDTSNSAAETKNSEIQIKE